MKKILITGANNRCVLRKNIKVFGVIEVIEFFKQQEVV